MRRWVFLLSLAGCPGDDAPDDAGATDESPESGAVDSTATDCASDVPPNGAFLGVTVVDAAGAPLDGDDVPVQYCRGQVCLTANCVEANLFRFGGLAAGGGSLEIVPLRPEARLSTPFVPFTLDENGSHALTVRVPTLDAGADLPATPAPVEVADGLFLTAGRGDVVAPTPLDPEPTWIAGVHVAPAAALPVQGIPGTVLAVYYLSPFDHPTRPVAPGSEERLELPVKLANRWEIAEDGQAELWIGDYLTFSWNKVGDLALVDDGAALAPSSGITRISTLVVVRKPAP